MAEVGRSGAYDVVIVGGGVVGSSIAYFLAADPDFDGRVLVVERDPTYAESSTALSVGGLRQQFSTPENIRISHFGADFVRGAHETLAVEGSAPELGFVEAGYLFLATERGVDVLRRNHELQTSLGAAVALLTPDELVARFPWLSPVDLAAGSLGLSGEGWLDPYSLLMAFKAKARALGVAYESDEVVEIQRDGSRVTGVRTASGATISAGAVVNAAGPVAALVATMAGIPDLPVRPRKRPSSLILCTSEAAKGSSMRKKPAPSDSSETAVIAIRIDRAAFWPPESSSESWWTGAFWPTPMRIRQR